MDVEQNNTKVEQILNANDRQIISLQKELIKVKRNNQVLNEEKNNLLKIIKDKETAIETLEKEKRESFTAQAIASLDCTNYKREAEIYGEFLRLNLDKTDFFVKTIKQLDTELKKKLGSIKDLDRDNLRLTNEKSALANMESLFQKKEEIYKSTINKLFEDMNQGWQTFQTKIVDLEHKLEVELNTSQRLRGDMETLNKTIDSLENAMKEQNEEHQIEIQNLQSAIDLALNEKRIIVEETERLRKEVKDKDEALNEREQKALEAFQEKNKQISSLNEEVKNLQVKLVEKDAQLTRISEQNRQFQVRETLLNNGIEKYDAEKETLSQLMKEDLLEELRKMHEALALERGEKVRLQTKYNDMKKEMSDKIPLLLDKQAEFSKASEENDNLRKKVQDLMEELTKVYEEKISHERELKRFKEGISSDNFDSAFLSSQVTKLLIQNNKLRTCLADNIGKVGTEKLLMEDMVPENSFFYQDIDDLKNKHLILAKRFKDLKGKIEKDSKVVENVHGKRPARAIEDDENEQDIRINEEGEDVTGQKKEEGKEIIEKKRKIERMEIELKTLKESQDAKIKQLNTEILDLKSKLRKVEQEKALLGQELKLEKNNNNSQLKNQTLNFENHFKKAESSEAEIKRLLDEKEALKNKISEKERTLSDLIGKLSKVEKEKSVMKNRLDIAEANLKNSKEFETRLNRAIEEAQTRPVFEGRDPYQSIQELREENLLMKMKIENQTVLTKNYRDRCISLQNLLNDLSRQFKENSERLHNMFFEDENKQTNSSYQEAFILRGKLTEMREILNFYRQELYSQTSQYQAVFDKIEEMMSVIAEDFSKLGNKFSEEEKHLKDRLKNVETDHIQALQGLQSKVDTYLQNNQQEEEEYEDNDWVHISEHRELGEKLRMEQENVKSLQTVIEGMREHLLTEREANVNQSNIKQQENEQVKKYLLEINKLTDENNNLHSTLIRLRKDKEEVEKDLSRAQDSFEKELTTLVEENRNLTESLGKLANQNIEESGIFALEQRNNLLKYLREKNIELAVQRDQLRSKLFALKKSINNQKNEKLQQMEKLETELINLKRNKELESVPQTRFLKEIIEENKTLHQENTKNRRILTRQEQQIKTFEQYRREEAEQEGNSPGGLEDDDEDVVTVDKVLSLLERAKAQYEVLGKLDIRDQTDQA